MKTKKKSTLWVASAVLVISLFLLIFASQIPPKKSSTGDALCPDIDSFAENIKNSLGDNYDITISDPPIYVSQVFLWRRNNSEPKIGYPVQRSRTVTILSQNSKLISSLFEKDTIKDLSDFGYLLHSLNFSPFSESDFVSGGLGIYGFTKRDQYFSVELYDQPNDDRRTEISGTLVINCGVANSEYDLLYDKIIKTKKYTTNDTIAIYEVKDGVVMLSVGLVNSAGGHASFWLITDTQTKQLIKGTQEGPICSIFEDIKVGRGLDCFDNKTETSRVVDY